MVLWKLKFTMVKTIVLYRKLWNFYLPWKTGTLNINGI